MVTIFLGALLDASAIAPKLPTREASKTYTLPNATKWQKRL